MSKPKVSIIIVNYNGEHLLTNCLNSLLELTYPKSKTEIIVVDNNSSDGSVSLLKKKFSSVTLIELHENTGFTGGNSVGYAAATGEYIVLLNSDIEVAPDWLSNLVQEAQSNPKIGLVSSKLYFANPYIKLTLQSSTIMKSELDGSTDFCPVGIVMEEVISTKTIPHPILYGLGIERRHQDTDVPTVILSEKSEVFVPVTDENTLLNMRFYGYPNKASQPSTIQVLVGREKIYNATMTGHKPTTFTFNSHALKPHSQYLIQNAGNVVLSNGFSKDIGTVTNIKFGKKIASEHYDEDSDFYKHSRRVPAVCGAACLIKREVIDQVGFLDGNYFMYYEDVELSIRAQKIGYICWYAASAQAYHMHQATTKSLNESFFIRMTEKNHLLFVWSYFPWSTVFSESASFCLRLTHSNARKIYFKFKSLEKTKIWTQKALGYNLALVDFLKTIHTALHKRFFWGKRSSSSISNLQESWIHS